MSEEDVGVPNVPAQVLTQEYYKDQGLKAAGIQVEAIVNEALGRESGIHGIWSSKETQRPARQFVKHERKLRLMERAANRAGMNKTKGVLEDLHKNLHELYDGYHPPVRVMITGAQQGKPATEVVPVQAGSEEYNLLHEVRNRTEEDSEDRS